MADPVNGNEVEEELVDYEEEEAPEPDQAAKGEEGVKRGYVGLHTAGFKEFLLKPEILRAITKNAFEHPSEGTFLDLKLLSLSSPAQLPDNVHSFGLDSSAVQHQCIPSATMGSDVLCQAKSGMGKTAVFVLSILQQIRVEFDETTKIAKVGALVMAHTRELAFQVRLSCLEYLVWQSTRNLIAFNFFLSFCRYPASSIVSMSPWQRSLGLQSFMEAFLNLRTSKH